ncbi:MAG TPA: hypothetical protein VGW10_15260 [Solirubrobacteraceae bacterium]|nr:hypothetical protein [Solirubrobacteraceae bacterium]
MQPNAYRNDHAETPDPGVPERRSRWGVFRRREVPGGLTLTGYIVVEGVWLVALLSWVLVGAL